MKRRPGISISIALCLSAFACQLVASKASAQIKDVCGLVDTADATALLGEEVSAPQAESSGRTGSATCRFLTSKVPLKSLSVLVQYAQLSPTSMADHLKALLATNVQQVPGVGDDAAWGSMTIAGRTICQLSVRKGKSMRLLLMISGLPDDPGLLSRARILALKILAKT
jgi:hypothetical protein